MHFRFLDVNQTHHWYCHIRSMRSSTMPTSPRRPSATRRVLRKNSSRVSKRSRSTLSPRPPTKRLSTRLSLLPFKVFPTSVTILVLLSASRRVNSPINLSSKWTLAPCCVSQWESSFLFDITFFL